MKVFGNKKVLKDGDIVTIDGGRQMIVVGDDKDKYYVVDKDDMLYCVAYEK